MISFLVQYASVISELNKLTKIKFHDGNPLNPLDYQLKRILEFHNQGNYQLRDYQLKKVAFMVKHLKEIEGHDEKLLKHFIKQLKKHVFSSNSFQNYFGIRCEIYVAASLIRKEVTFEKQETPDFRICFDDANVFIECCSCNLTQENINDVKYKISSIVNKKSNKSYCKSNTSLFIDVTNLYFHNTLRANFAKQDAFEDLREYVKDAIQRTNFGNVTLFTYYINKELDTMESAYMRIDNDNIDKNLLEFLNTHYPLGKLVVKSFLIPDQG